MSKNPRDAYATPLEAWKDVLHFVPSDTPIWLPFYLNGGAKRAVESFGFTDVLQRDEDFFAVDYPDRLIVDNPPFSKKQTILDRLLSRTPDRKVILLLPLNTLGRQYMRPYIKGLQVLIPKSRYDFGGTTNVPFKACWFAWNCQEMLGSREQFLLC